MNRPPKIQQRVRSLPEGEYRTRCYGCYRPVESCFCDAIPRIKNQTEVLILQHQRERAHPFNTARIVHQALDRCELIFDRNESFAQRQLPIRADAALLFPGKESTLIDDLPKHKRPKQLVLIDGTWDQAKTLFRDIPQLHQLPQLKLSPSSPGQYRIRLEPTSTSLSTLEATVQSLQQLEPETPDLNLLLRPFDTMVEQQLAHPIANYESESGRSKIFVPNVPKSLGRNPANIIVAYGEATPLDFRQGMPWHQYNRLKKEAAKQPPLYWVAQRLAPQGESSFFAELICPVRPVSASNLKHLGLESRDFEQTVSLDQFRKRWTDFVGSDDLLVVPNKQTIRLLRQSGVKVKNHELLKSINFDPQRTCSGIADFLGSVSQQIAPPVHKGRAGIRLANSVALTSYLRTFLRPATSIPR